MDDLKPLAVFAEVVEAGSMSGAARRLGMSPSAVSQIVRALEQQGGVTLLHRSTRKLALGQDTSPAKPQPATMRLDLRSSDGEQQHVQVEARVASNNQVALQHLCEHGLGIGRMIHAEVQLALESGALVRVLPEWRIGSLPVWAVTPNLEASEAAKVRTAVDYLKRHFAKLTASTP